MPRAARFRITAVEDLLAQLRYAPEETRRKQMDAAETLIGDLDPAQNYPREFIIYRITAYRSDAGDDPVTFVGEALVPDLVNFVQALSWGLTLTEDDLGRRALSLEDVAARLNVSSKTVQRYRKQGLVCHYIVGKGGDKRLACFEDALEQFASVRRDQLDRAAGFTRIDERIESDIVRAARDAHARGGGSLNEVALLVSQRFDRAHETVRAILRRHDRRAPAPIFSEHGPLGARDTRLIHRALRRGVSVSLLMRRFGKSRQTIVRAATRHQAERLRALDVDFVDLPTFALEEAATVILAGRARDTDPPAGVDLDDAMAVLDWVTTAPAVGDDDEVATVAAYHFLRRRAAASIDALGAWPSAGRVEDIERDLRWAARLKRRLVIAFLPSMIPTIEQHLHRSLREQPADEIRRFLYAAVAVLASTVDSVDPSRDQRVERVARYALGRRLATMSVAPSARRAGAMHGPGAVTMPGLFDDLSAWGPLVDLPAEWEGRIDTVDDETGAQILRGLYGLDGRPPRTATELATELDRSAASIARLRRRAERALRSGSD